MRGFVSPDLLATLAAHFEPERAGGRLAPDAIDAPLLRVADSIGQALAPLGVDRTAVRFTSFDKSATANWAAPWHQDRVVAVCERVAVEGYGAWSAKGGFWHCEPPLAILERMVFVRIHLDRCNRANGAMEIALGSHNLGKVDAARAAAEASSSICEITEAAPGDVLVARALLLHRSRVAAAPARRRALRIDFAPRADLAPALEWAY